MNLHSSLSYTNCPVQGYDIPSAYLPDTAHFGEMSRAIQAWRQSSSEVLCQVLCSHKILFIVLLLSKVHTQCFLPSLH